ncbi:MerR family transcriptional regulator [Streptosporangium sp. G11]|uniref:helix-turn-helix domain-containing protein n=1 Tax=Streptosporangium sp. G11 TaxID=3436926 RepID=UPI003EBAD87A
MEWTIGELAERASAALTPTAQLNGRVRDMPNERLIRWYSTIGLLDPPSARRGRVAMYGRRHLLQIVAVKRRQSDGRTIAEIQIELAGATDQTLESIARLPEHTPAHPPEHLPEHAPKPSPAPPAQTGSPGTARPRFWAGPPSPAELAKPTQPSNPAKPVDPVDPAAHPLPPPRPAATRSPPPTPAAEPRPPAPATPPAPEAVIVHGVRLASGVTLMLDTGGHAPSPGDLAEIAAASEGLLSLLRERGFIPPEGIHA